MRAGDSLNARPEVFYFLLESKISLGCATVTDWRSLFWHHQFCEWSFVFVEKTKSTMKAATYLFLIIASLVEPATSRLRGDVSGLSTSSSTEIESSSTRHGAKSGTSTSELERKLQESGSRVHVIIGYENNQDPDLSSILSHPIRSGPGLKKINAVKAYISKEELEALQEDPTVRYVEENAVVTPFGTTYDDYPYGIRMSQADTPESPWPSRTFPSSSACSDENSFKVRLFLCTSEKLNQGICTNVAD